MPRKGGQVFTAAFIFFLGILFIILGFIESSEASKVLLYCFSFAFFICAMVLSIYLFFFSSSNEENFRF